MISKKTVQRRGRSFSPRPSIKRWRELVGEWKTFNRERRQDNLNELGFKKWLDFVGYDLDKEVQAAEAKETALELLELKQERRRQELRILIGESL